MRSPELDLVHGIMVTFETLRKLAMSFDEVTEEPHFEKTSFRVRKKIFVTYDEKTHRATVKLSEVDQDVFSLAGKGAIYPVDNKWGKRGWTIVELKEVSRPLLTDVITTAYREVAPRRKG